MKNWRNEAGQPVGESQTLGDTELQTQCQGCMRLPWLEARDRGHGLGCVCAVLEGKEAILQRQTLCIL